MNSTIQTILTIFQVIICIAVVAVVLLQSGKNAGLSGSLSGSSSVTFFGKNKGRSLDAKLERATGWLGAAFIFLTLVLLIFGK